MSKKQKIENQPPNKIRRSDRARDDDWIQNFLLHGAVGTLATSQDGQPFLVTRNYAYDKDNHAIYLHGATKGRTFENLLDNNKVCFSVSEMGRLLPADDALEVSIEFSGAVVFGTATSVKDGDEALHGLQLLLDKYFPHLVSGADYNPISSRALSITAVIRIDIEYWSGKEKKVEKEFPGAFYYNDIPAKLDESSRKG